jgi:hypothetical protein
MDNGYGWTLKNSTLAAVFYQTPKKLSNHPTGIFGFWQGQLWQSRNGTVTPF